MHVDGSSDTFAFGTATYVVAGGSHQYTWTGTGLSWAGSPTPTVRLREVVTGPAAPTNFMVRPAGDAKVALSWDAPASDSGVMRHEYQFETDGSYGNWIEIDDSGPGEINAFSFTVTMGIVNDTAYTFQLRAVSAAGDGAEAEAGPVTPTAAPRPTVTSVAVVSAPRSGDTYRLYETMRFAVTFSHPVQVVKPGPLRLEVGLDVPGGGSGSTVEAVFSGQSRSPTAATPADFPQPVFAFPLQGATVRPRRGRCADRRQRVAARLRGTRLQGTDSKRGRHGRGVGPCRGRSAVRPQGRRVGGRAGDRRDRGGLDAAAVVAGRREADTYGEDEIIRIEVRFDDPVQVEGEPTFALEVGDPCVSVCKAHYESGSGTDTLVFAYLVLEVDHDHNGIAIPADPIEVVYGDSIRNDAGHGAHLSYTRKGTQPGHKTDGSRTAASYFSVEDAEAHESDGKMEFTVRLEPHGLGIVTVDYATADGTGHNAARAGSDYTETSGTLRFNSLRTERTVSVPITDDAHEDDGETFTLTLSNPQGARLRPDDAEATGTIRNSEGVALTATFPESVVRVGVSTAATQRPPAGGGGVQRRRWPRSGRTRHRCRRPAASVAWRAAARRRRGWSTRTMFFLTPEGHGRRDRLPAGHANAGLYADGRHLHGGPEGG